MRASFLLLLALPALGQPVSISVVPAGPFVPGLTLYSVRACNVSPQPVALAAAALFGDAARQGFHLATYTAIQRAVVAQDAMSWQRKALVAIELSGGLLTALMATDAIKIEERYKAAIPVVAGGLALAQRYIKAPKTEVPADLIPAAGVTLAPGTCAEFTHPGVKQ